MHEADIAAGDAPARVAIEPLVPEDQLPPPPQVRGSDRQQRRIYIRRDAELARYRWTEQCVGCDAAKANTAPKAHSSACRTRIESEIEKNDAERMAKHEAAAKRVRGEDVEESEAKRPRGPPDAEEETRTGHGHANWQ